MPDRTHRPVEAMLPWDGPAIMLIDLDAFFASVEQLDHPEWRGLPVIVGGDSKRRGVVATCSYEARHFGVRSAMPSTTAEKLCPQAIWTPGNFPRYIEMSKQVMGVLTSVSPRLQQVSIDEAFLDVSPGHYVRDHPVQLAQGIIEAVAALGITCSIGLGSSKTVAKIASDQDKPRGLTVVYPGGEAAFLAPLAVRVLSGVGPAAARRLADFGIHSLGELACADDILMHSIFGKNAELMRDRCLGVDPSPVEADDTVKSVSNEMTFSTDLSEAEELRQAIVMIAAKVGRRLRHKALAGHTVTLKLRYTDLSIRTAQRTMPHPLDNEQVFAPLAVRLLPQIWRPGEAVRLVGIGISGFSAAAAVSSTASGGEVPGASVGQMSLFDGDGSADETATVVEAGASVNQSAAASQEKPPKLKPALVEATDRVRDRFGEQAVGYGRELRFKNRDTGTVGQKKDDHKDPLHTQKTPLRLTDQEKDCGSKPQ
ncbi:MAG: DNA polymerase IV [Actinomycetia bacterium]|nr:DNA polymerase IV [Actinomycetes bacterium]